jgi:hypothetical protein
MNDLKFALHQLRKSRCGGVDVTSVRGAKQFLNPNPPLGSSFSQTRFMGKLALKSALNIRGGAVSDICRANFI